MTAGCRRARPCDALVQTQFQKRAAALALSSALSKFSRTILLGRAPAPAKAPAKAVRKASHVASFARRAHESANFDALAGSALHGFREEDEKNDAVADGDPLRGCWKNLLLLIGHF